MGEDVGSVFCGRICYMCVVVWVGAVGFVVCGGEEGVVAGAYGCSRVLW